MDQMIAINKIYNEDCLDGMQKIDDKSIDLICTDLPYGQTARNKWDSVIPFEPLWEQYERIIKDNGAIILFGNGMFTADLMQSNRKLWRYNIIWEKTQPSGHLNANKMPLRKHEDICVFYKKLPTYNPQKTSGHPRKVSKTEHKRNSKKSTDYREYDFVSYDKFPYDKPQTDEVARGSGNREYGCRRLREKLPNFSGVSFFRAGNSSNRVNAFHICVYVHRCAVPRYIALQYP